MTMRTYRYFICPNGHRGMEKTSENDQPFSTAWESIKIEGMLDNQSEGYLCSQCQHPMKQTEKLSSA
jgi:hypothetical protein